MSESEFGQMSFWGREPKSLMVEQIRPVEAKATGPAQDLLAQWADDVDEVADMIGDQVERGVLREIAQEIRSYLKG